MKVSRFGDTELQVSELGFGCGAVGGLMVLGDHKEMMNAVEYAIDSGINYFDTARMYGDGLSEIHTGAILRELNKADFITMFISYVSKHPDEMEDSFFHTIRNITRPYCAELEKASNPEFFLDEEDGRRKS